MDAARLSDTLVTAAVTMLSVALVVAAVSAALTRTTSTVRQPVPAGALAQSMDEGRSGSGRRGAAPALGQTVTGLMLLGALLVCAAVAARGVAAGRAPWGNMYEFALTGSAAVALAFLAYGRGRQVVGLAVWVSAVVLVLLGVAMTTLYTPVDELVPVLDSRWLVVHVAAAITSGGLFTLGALATVAHLVRQRGGRRGETPFSELAHTVHLVAFPIWTFAVIAGAVWAENAWGRYWGWDPKETWAFITWVLYAAHLHALSTVGWRRRAGWLALAGFAAFVFNFFGVNLWIPGLHSYAGV